MKARARGRAVIAGHDVAQATVPGAARRTGTMVVVPPQAADTPPVKKSSAVISPLDDCWSMWQCASTPPGMTRRPDGVDLPAARPEALAQRRDAPVARRRRRARSRAGVGDHRAAANDQIEHAHVIRLRLLQPRASR